jgi:hypothetical protein
LVLLALLAGPHHMTCDFVPEGRQERMHKEARELAAQHGPLALCRGVPAQPAQNVLSADRVPAEVVRESELLESVAAIAS